MINKKKKKNFSPKFLVEYINLNEIEQKKIEQEFEVS